MTGLCHARPPLRRGCTAGDHDADLVGGVASTVCWPLSGVSGCAGRLAWRVPGLRRPALLVALPWCCCSSTSPGAPGDSGHHTSAAGPLSSPERKAFLLFAGVLVLGGAIMSLVSVHLITLLQTRGVALASAVSYGALIGPA